MIFTILAYYAPPPGIVGFVLFNPGSGFMGNIVTPPGLPYPLCANLASWYFEAKEAFWLDWRWPWWGHHMTTYVEAKR